MSGETIDTGNGNDDRRNEGKGDGAAVVPLLRSHLLARADGASAPAGADAAAQGAARVAHGFTTREGGVTAPPWGPLDLARRPEVPVAHLIENWDRVARALSPELDHRHVAVLSQVHGAEVVEVHETHGALEPVATADAAFTRRRGIVLAVRTADCVPVLVAGREAVGVAHAGWRGTAAGVVPALIGALTAAGERPHDLRVAVGPAISGEAYEVGAEVVDGLRSAGIPDAVFLVGGHPRPHVDLRAAVRHQLVGCGVEQIEVLVPCTSRDPSLHSHRRDGARAGRQAGVIVRWP